MEMTKYNCKNEDYFIDIARTPQKKMEVILSCDSAFDITLTQRENYNSLIEKLKNNATVIYAFNKSILGYIAFYANDFVNKLAYITLIAVKKEYQSNHIGTALLTKCSDYARSLGFKTLKLEVKNDNYPAINCYLKNGFEFADYTDRNSRYMVKAL